jgi:hypothetical protein
MSDPEKREKKEIGSNLIYGCKSFHSHFDRSLKSILKRSAGVKGNEETLKE